MPTFCVLIATGLGRQAFPDTAAFETTVGAFVTGMKDMQRWALQSTSQPMIPSALEKHAPTGGSEEYLLARNCAFGLFSLLRSYLMPECKDEADREKRCHIALLWIINKILCGLRDDYERSISFLDNLHGHVESAIEPTPKETCDSIHIAQSPRLKFTIMLAILRRAGAPLLHSGPDEAARRTRCSRKPESSEREWREIFAVLELLHLLSP